MTRDGDRYAATTRVGGIGSTLDDTRLAPGIPRHGAIVFELPTDRLAGARLFVSDQGPPTGWGTRLASTWASTSGGAARSLRARQPWPT